MYIGCFGYFWIPTFAFLPCGVAALCWQKIYSLFKSATSVSIVFGTKDLELMTQAFWRRQAQEILLPSGGEKDWQQWKESYLYKEISLQRVLISHSMNIFEQILLKRTIALCSFCLVLSNKLKTKCALILAFVLKFYRKKEVTWAYLILVFLQLPGATQALGDVGRQLGFILSLKPMVYIFSLIIVAESILIGPCSL